MARSIVGRRPLSISTGRQAAKLRSFETTTITGGKAVGKERTKLINKAVKLIKLLGFDAASKQVKQGKQSAADTFRFINSSRLSGDPTRRIAGVAERAARQAGI